MTKKKTFVDPSEVTGQEIDKMLSTIRIPPRPSLLLEVQQELKNSDPSPKKLSGIIGQDVAMSAALLKLANSAFVGLRLKAKSVEQAVMRLGMEQCSLLLTGLLARDAVHVEGISLNQFWDSSNKRAQAMSFYAKKMTLCRSDLAHTFGLFSNIGVPLMMSKFPDYGPRMDVALKAELCVTTRAENQLFGTSHTALGALMARTWGLPDEVVDAILLHHSYDVLKDQNTASIVRNLVALSLVVDYAIFRSHSRQRMNDWELGGKAVCGYLGMSELDADDMSEQIQQMFEES